MAQRDATNGQKDANATNEIKHRETLLRNIYLCAVVLFNTSGFLETHNSLDFYWLSLYKLGNISFVTCLQCAILVFPQYIPSFEPSSVIWCHFKILARSEIFSRGWGNNCLSDDLHQIRTRAQVI